MNRTPATPRCSLASRWSLLLIGGVSSGAVLAARAQAPDATSPRGVVQLPTYDVRGDRLEDFGFRVSPDRDLQRSRDGVVLYDPVIDVVLPNTAAAKAGLIPGDRILAADGVPTLDRSRSLKSWHAMQTDKWRMILAGQGGDTWRLTVERTGTWEIMTMTLKLPTPAPHWGSPTWQKPAGRPPVIVGETGPLSQRAREILEHGISMMLRTSYVRGLQLPLDAEHPVFLCQQWTLRDEHGVHRMYVSQQRGRTDIVLEAIARESWGVFAGTTPTMIPDKVFASAATVHATSARAYLTSPAAILERAWQLGFRQKEIELASAEAGFRAEVEFWANKVGRASGRWPFAVLPAGERTATVDETR